jgi:hypothetical protein
MTTRLWKWVWAAAAATACSGTPTRPSAIGALGLGLTATTDAFEYWQAPNDSIEVTWQETYHRWAIEALAIAAPRRIRYNKYQNRDHMQALIGVGNTNGFADAASFEIHTIWSHDNHEVVHLYSSAFGRPVALWSEGLAVAFQTDPAAGHLEPRWSGVPLDDSARQLRASGRLIPIGELLTTAGFRRFDSNVSYPEAGSFTRYVLSTCGLDGVKRLFGAGAVADSADSVAAQFEAACHHSIAAAEQAWLAALETR